MTTHRIRRVLAALALLVALTGCSGMSASRSTPAVDPAAPPIRHVFIIMLENAKYETLYGVHPEFPFLADVLRPQGTLLSQFYGIGHWSLGNYLALLGGVSQTKDTQGDCIHYRDLIDPKPAPDGQVRAAGGCVYPAWVPALPTQLSAKHLTWKGYLQDMGNRPGREQPICGRPSTGLHDADLTQKAAPGDAYAARHNPFIYFASIRDTAACHTQVVPLTRLAQDLKSVNTTADFSYIAPNLCDDGHNRCPEGQDPDGWLKEWIPKITASPSYRNGMIIILADESVRDSRACCHEPSGPNVAYPGGPTKKLMDTQGHGEGGGRIGALILSPYVLAGGTSNVPYNDYSLLRSVENIFGVAHLGYAAQAGLRPFGPDVWHAAPSTRTTPPTPTH